MKDITKSWHGLYKFRKEVRKSYPNFWDIKVVKKPLDIVLPYLFKGCKILDVGAGNRRMGKKLEETRGDLLFKSMDIDRDRHHDYYSLDDVDDTFDIVLLFEVIEHLEFSEGVEMLSKIKGFLKKGGKLIVTTPNLFHPNRYWEYSHKVSYRYDELSGLLLSLGYNISDIYRIYNDAFIRRIIRLYLMSHIHSYFSVDFARSIAIVAEG